MNFYFYDLETSGTWPRFDRIMQFAGQRTDMSLKPLGQPDNFLIKLDEDILPQPDAILTHGITPQKARAEGLSEAEFLKHFFDTVVKPRTIFVGFNNIRFDDEFMRYTLWRNFYDSYEWQWKDGCGRWDLLDMARMTRALRPDGIEWPFASDGKPSVRLELMAAVNKLTHDNAHDALSDVHASIALARLLRLKQPKLFDYLLQLRDKAKVEVLVNSGEPIIYSSGRYPSEYLKTTIAIAIGPTKIKGSVFMYDLRVDPEKFIKMTPKQLAEAWATRGETAEYFPIKRLGYNRAPAIAPLSVLDKISTKRLKINMSAIDQNRQKLKVADNFASKLREALEIMYGPTQKSLVVDHASVDAQLYEGFVSNADRIKMSVVRAAGADDIARLELDFDDERLKLLLPLYRARNFPGSLNSDEQNWWQDFRRQKLLTGGSDSQATKYFSRLKELKDKAGLKPEQLGLLQELEIYGQSILPAS